MKHVHTWDSLTNESVSLYEPMFIVDVRETFLGRCRLVATEERLVELSFLDTPPAESDWKPQTPLISTYHSQISRGSIETAFKEPKQQPEVIMAGTAFQISVWQWLWKIGARSSMSYGEIAQALGKPTAARAVGGAVGANPIPVVMPCHRVLAANGKLGGFSGGLDRKRALLDAELEGNCAWQLILEGN